MSKKNEFKTPVGEKEVVTLKRKDFRHIARRSGKTKDEIRIMYRAKKEWAQDMRVQYTVVAD